MISSDIRKLIDNVKPSRDVRPISWPAYGPLAIAAILLSVGILLSFLLFLYPSFHSEKITKSIQGFYFSGLLIYFVWFSGMTIFIVIDIYHNIKYYFHYGEIENNKFYFQMDHDEKIIVYLAENYSPLHLQNLARCVDFEAGFAAGEGKVFAIVGGLGAGGGALVEAFKFGMWPFNALGTGLTLISIMFGCLGCRKLAFRQRLLRLGFTISEAQHIQSSLQE